MTQDLLKHGAGRFFRGNLHCHSDRSDGHWPPERVAAAYRDAGYHFVMISDHFEANYGWRITDTRDLRDAGFTTIIGAELSSAAWTERTAYWVTAAGLPLDFAPPAPGNHAEAIARAAACGAFVTLLHPGLNNLPLAAAATLPALDALHAVELYNHNMASGGMPDHASGAYMLDGLLEQSRRLLVAAGDDAHFGHPADRFGGWLEVYAEQLDPAALLGALHAGRYYATQGPALRQLQLDGDRLYVEASPVYAITLSGGGDRWLNSAMRHRDDGQPIVEAEFDLAPFRGSFCRVTAVDINGKRAWSNPLWL
jgi:hypothetical protein